MKPGQALKQATHRARDALTNTKPWTKNPFTADGRQMVKEHNEQAIAEFLANGGKIKQCPPCGDGLDANHCGFAGDGTRAQTGRE
jgi:hypothetical protein